MSQIGKIEIVSIREAFKHEAHDFTVWLEDNIDTLAERLGLELTVLEREKTVGSFNVDLFCEDDNGNTVIIENQLERTDHDHLGKLLTYLVNLEAKTAIWIATEARPEHQRVIDWLNESTGSDMAFYFVQVEAVRIGDSPIAPLFNVLARPDEQTREIGEQKKEFSERHHLRQEFWTQLLDKSKGRTKLTENRSPTRDHWLSVSTGKSGILYNYLLWTDKSGVELYIDTKDYDRNKKTFDMLFADKQAIETEFGTAFNWQRLDEKRTCRIICAYDDLGGLRTPDNWPKIQERLIESMIRLDKVFRKRIKQLNI